MNLLLAFIIAREREKTKMRTGFSVSRLKPLSPEFTPQKESPFLSALRILYYFFT